METLNLSREEIDCILAIRSDYAKNMDWLLAHYDELRKLHPDKYVAVLDQKPVAFANSVETLMQILSRGTVDVRSVAIKKLSSKREELFF